jgi:Tol biopolymer transport system component
MGGAHAKLSRPAARVAFVFALALAALALAAPPAGATFPGTNGAIYFVRSGTRSDGTVIQDIYSVRANGNQLVRVTNTGFAERPAVSPNGNQLAYSAFDSQGNTQLFIAGADGGSPKQITSESSSSSPPCCADATDASFDRSGLNLVFAAHQTDFSNYQLWSGASDGGRTPNFRTYVDPGANQLEPELLPDGNTIVLTRAPTSSVSAERQLETVQVGFPTPLVAGRDPSVAPDGSRIAFTVGDPSLPNHGIDTIQPNGADQRSLLPFGSDPSYSPNGRRIVFVREVPATGESSLWIARASDGSLPAKLTDPPPGFVDFAPYWAVASPSQPRAACDGRPATIAGTARDERLAGTGRRDVIGGARGADKVRGKGGRDLLCGGRGDDVLRGGSGPDVVRGGRGNDPLIGGRGHDRCYGGRGRDRFRGCEDVVRG